MNLKTGLVGLFVAAGLVGCGGGGTNPDMGPAGDLAETQAELIANGAKDVTNRGCPLCHQAHGRDGMPVGPTLAGGVQAVPGSMYYGANLTPDPTTGIGTWTDAQIITAMTQGINNMGVQLCWVMPKWQLSTTEEDEIVAYLRSIPPVVNAVTEGTCPTP